MGKIIDIILHCWGVLFRFLFISILGVVLFNTIDTKNLFDIPISQITLSDVFNNLLAAGVAIGCVCWLINTPKNDDEDPYIKWAGFSAFLLFIGALLYSYITNN